MPQRHRRERTLGWRKPVGAVIVDRTSKRWGNPFRVGDVMTTSGGPFGRVELVIPDRAYAVSLYAMWLSKNPDLVAAIRRELAGRDLCCPCPLDEPCHADLQLWVANCPEHELSYLPLYGMSTT